MPGAVVNKRTLAATSDGAPVTSPDDASKAAKRQHVAAEAAQQQPQKQSDQRDNLRYTKSGNPLLTPLTGHEEQFAELGNMQQLYRGTTAKARQHVNPLTSQNQKLLDPPEGGWGAVFADPTLPLQVDIGCGSGRFVLIRATRLKGAANVLGLEIRAKLVDRALVWRDRLKDAGKVNNAHFMSGNATISLEHLLGSYPGGVQLVSIQYPDPHFKKRHYKRRVVQPATVKHIASVLKPGGRLVVQGDVPEPLRYIRNMVEQHGDGCFALSPENRGAPAPRAWQNMAATPADSDTAADDAVDGVIAASRGDDDDDDEVVNVNGGEERKTGGTPASSSGLLHNEWAGAPEETEAYSSKWAHDNSVGWLDPACNPLGVPTEREVYVLRANVEVYRCILDRV